MEFKLKPFSQNLFPKGAVLVCHTSPRYWLQEIQQMGINLNDVAVFAVPSAKANVLYGCLIVFKSFPKNLDIGRNMFFQNIHNQFFIPENAIISPLISLEEMQSVFTESYHVFHNDFGLVALDNEVDWMELLIDNREVVVKVGVPSKSVSIPKHITSLRIEVDEEAVLKQLDTPEAEQEFLDNLPFNMKKVLNGNKKEIDKFLKYLEKHPEMALQLGIPLDVMNTSRGDFNGKFKFSKNSLSWLNFKSLLGKSNSNGSNSTGSGSGIFGNMDTSIFQNSKYAFFKIILVVFFLSKLIAVGTLFTVLKWVFVLAIMGAIIYFIIRITADKEEVSNGSYSNNYRQSQTNNTNDKYFPIVVTVILSILFFLIVKRFISDDSFNSTSSIVPIVWLLIIVFSVIAILIKAFNNGNFNAGNSSNSTSGNATLLDSDRFSSLHKRYEDLAQDFISKKEYEKAAHVYLKLLQNKVRAAQVLEEGKMYQEAALVYLKHCQNKLKAAECYENGKAYQEAISLYKEFNMPEKVGDLYVLMNQKKSANEYYYKVVDDYITNYQYIKASLILKNKVGDISQAQNLLLDGWRTNKDATNCLSYYFSDIEDKKQLKYEIGRVYKEETSTELLESFLVVLKKEYERSLDLKEYTKEIAYEIIAKRIHQNPQIASELIAFNKTNTTITKDVMKYKFNRKKIG